MNTINNNNNPNIGNNNINTINQHLNNLGTINHQLNTLSQQLSGLNHQSQNLQKFGNSSANSFAQLYPMNNLSETGQQQQQQQQHADTFQTNQELLHRLQCLTLYGNQAAAGLNNFTGTPTNNTAAFMFSNANANATATHHRSNNHLFPTNVGGGGNLSPSPIMNRSLYSASPSMFEVESLGVSMERNLDRNSSSTSTANSRGSPFIRPLSQNASTATLAADSPHGSQAPSAFADATMQRKVQRADFVMLQVTDESGNVTNTRKMSATPSHITRTTSEKVPHRSQLMSEVQRTTWARHTTK